MTLLSQLPKPGYVRILASSVGFEQYLSEEFQVTNAVAVFIEIPLAETAEAIEEIVVKAQAKSDALIADAKKQIQIEKQIKEHQANRKQNKYQTNQMFFINHDQIYNILETNDDKDPKGNR